MSTHNLCFEQKYEKHQSFLSENFQFLEVKFSIYLNSTHYIHFLEVKFSIYLNSTHYIHFYGEIRKVSILYG